MIETGKDSVEGGKASSDLEEQMLHVLPHTWVSVSSFYVLVSMWG